ncbi:HlyD family secretion protein [Calothrix sp. UHCC 0171]|uniref:HlyD family secretion protein n=1 Tax=Calothrix sp. UHCC 0171 TaxID=3110245 RepID=UPI002B21295C|nr:HlyD family efflux transporter periplasmic adaptor subunit [Calothrix sp. UHCC 0171]MEA5571724.1 HlyD family efflux transporter periplasmic adaptor subunit [Calothrix sp. UHCC 0171]
MKYSDSSDKPQPVEANNSSSQIVLETGGDIFVRAKEPSPLLTPLVYPKTHKPWLWGCLTVGTVAVLIAGVNRWLYLQEYEETNQAYITSDILPVNARVPGQVANVTAKENQNVKKGTVLVKLNPKEYKAKLEYVQASLGVVQEQAKAAAKNLNSAKAKITTQKKSLQPLKTTDTTVVQARNNLNVTRTQLRHLEPKLIKAELERDRLLKLQAKGFLSPKKLENITVKYNTLKLQRNNLDAKVKRSQTKLIQTQLNFLDNQEKITRGILTKIQTSLNSLETEIKLTKQNIQNHQQQANKNLQNSNFQDSHSVNTNNPQKIDLSDFNAKLAQQKKLIAQKESQEKRITQLYSQKKLLLLLAEGENNRYAYDISKQRYNLIQNSISVIQQQLKTVQYQLYYTKITAPTNGQVNIKRVQTGQKVQSGQTLMSVIPEKPWIAATFAGEQLQKIKPGQKVKIKISQLSNQTFTGKVQGIHPPVSTSALTPSQPSVKISLETNIWTNHKSQINSGTPVTVRVKLN